MRVEDGGELGVRGKDGGAQCPDRALLSEQRPGIQSAPRACRPDAGADLEVNVPVRITCPAGLV